MRKEGVIETLKHMFRVAFISISFVNKSKIKVNRRRLFLAALFHDIGKLKLDREILNAKRKLTKEEMKYVRGHAHQGAELLRHFRFISEIIKYHHENYDGTGYYGVKGNLIPIESQIIRLADVFDSLTHKRPYKNALNISTTLEIMQDENKNFNPFYFEQFVKYATKFKEEEVCVSQIN